MNVKYSIVSLFLVGALTVGVIACEEEEPEVITPTAATSTSSVSIDAVLQAVEEANTQLGTYQSALDQLQVVVGDTQARLNQMQGTVDEQLQSMVSAEELGAVQLTVADLKLLVDALALKWLVYPKSIGTTTQEVNGIGVTFISNTITIPPIEEGDSAYSQLAIRLTNLRETSITNLDVVGTLGISQSLYYLVEEGYPKVTDAAKGFTFVSSFDGFQTVSWEVYTKADGKVITIPPGGSITLRPKMELKTKTYAAGLGTVTAFIKTIVYDTVEG